MRYMTHMGKRALVKPVFTVAKMVGKYIENEIHKKNLIYKSMLMFKVVSYYYFFQRLIH